MIKDKRETFSIKWLHSKYGNFKKDKIYVSNAQFITGKGDNRLYTGFRIKDEDGDFYTLNADRIGKDFIILD